jgi:hypothetical protein
VKPAAHAMLAMQRAAGNRAVANAVAQREPDSGQQSEINATADAVVHEAGTKAGAAPDRVAPSRPVLGRSVERHVQIRAGQRLVADQAAQSLINLVDHDVHDRAPPHREPSAHRRPRGPG